MSQYMQSNMYYVIDAANKTDTIVFFGIQSFK